MRIILLGAASLVLAACVPDARGGDAGAPDAGDVCSRRPAQTCHTRFEYCDEVYSESSAEQLRELCDEPGEDTLSFGECSHTACCYGEDGLFNEPSLHCLPMEYAIEVGYRAACVSRGDTYCER